ncbi:MAG: TlpA family protein disulfide reductase [Bacteroidetes bacterium]|nr:TlpA family protein disulfide reductase [Bacteroidota bacterium]
MRIMQPARLLCAIAALLAAAPLLRAEEPDAASILKRSDSACAAVRTVRYYGSYTYARSDTTHWAGPVAIARLESGGPLGARARYDITGGLVAYDGHTCMAVSDAKKMVWLDTGATATEKITGNIAGRLVLPMFTTLGSFREMLDSDAISARLTEHRTIGGVDCYSVQLILRSDGVTSNDTAIWDIGVKDYLPRHYLKTLMYDITRHVREMTITDLQANVPIPEAVFAPALPKDYTAEYIRPAAPSAPAPALTSGAPAPAWSLPTENGTLRSLESLRGKVVVMDFWYINCGWCMRSYPIMERIHQRYASRGVEVIGVNCFDKDADGPAAFLRRRGVTYQTVLHGDNVAKAYLVEGYPTTVVIGADGNVLCAEVGYSEDLEQSLGSVLDANIRR